MCPLFRGSTVHKEEDNLSIVDKTAGPNVSSIQRFQCVLILIIKYIYLYTCEGVYIRKRTTSLEWTKQLVPMCPLFGGSTVHVHKEEDNLSIVDKTAGPNVSFIRRFHCTQGKGQPLYSGQNSWSQCVLYSEVPHVHKEEDNLCIVDKTAGSNVSFIQRFHMYTRKRTTSV